MSAANGALPGGTLREKQKGRVPGVMAPGVADGLAHGVSGEVAWGLKPSTTRESTALEVSRDTARMSGVGARRFKREVNGGLL